MINLNISLCLCEKGSCKEQARTVAKDRGCETGGLHCNYGKTAVHTMETSEIAFCEKCILSRPQCVLVFHRLVSSSLQLYSGKLSKEKFLKLSQTFQDFVAIRQHEYATQKIAQPVYPIHTHARKRCLNASETPCTRTTHPKTHLPEHARILILPFKQDPLCKTPQFSSR